MVGRPATFGVRGFSLRGPRVFSSGPVLTGSSGPGRVRSGSSPAPCRSLAAGAGPRGLLPGPITRRFAGVARSAGVLVWGFAGLVVGFVGRVAGRGAVGWGDVGQGAEQQAEEDLGAEQVDPAAGAGCSHGLR